MTIKDEASEIAKPSLSGFATLPGSGCDQSLLTLCGFDHRVFRELLTLFTALY